MSKAAKQSIFILIALLILSIGFGGFTLIQKQKLQDENAQLQGNLRQSKKQVQDLSSQANQLKSSLDAAKQEQAKLQNAVRAAQEQADSLRAQVEEKTEEAKKFKGRVDDLSKTRDQLLSKVQELNTELVKAKEARPAPKPEVFDTGDEDDAAMTRAKKKGTSDINMDEDAYWASVLKAKASLELEVEKLKTELSNDALEILELKQENADLQIELDELVAAKEEIEGEIKFKEDMVNNLSLELARSKNDKKFVTERADKLTTENNELRRQIKNLVTSKSALEKSIVRISQDKSKIEKELGQTESIIQSKIDEIWEIKESLDKTIKETDMKKPANTGIELPPIVVSSEGDMAQFDPGASNPGFSGAVVSVNDSNNFVITDIGQKSGVRLGDQLSVYRDSKYIARLEVIQVRQDISAADIKDQWTKIQVGDTVR